VRECRSQIWHFDNFDPDVGNITPARYQSFVESEPYRFRKTPSHVGDPPDLAGEAHFSDRYESGIHSYLGDGRPDRKTE
jgi:hypothetical protein